MSKPVIGFIGLGLMGGNMVENLQKRGFEVIVMDLNKDAVAAVLARGNATEASSPKELAEKSDIVELCVTTSEVVEKLVYGADGILEGIKDGSVLIDFGTSIPASSQKIGADLGKKGVGMIDAPLGRTPAHAKDGLLNIMAGGDKATFDKLKGYIAAARTDSGADVICGGTCDDRTGYFIAPTIIQAHAPRYTTMETELFGPVLTVFLYENDDFEGALEMCDKGSLYALTGSIFATKEADIQTACDALRFTAGNFYINDKPTGAVVGQQPFGGSRASGTNDKAGSYLNLIRWVSPRTTKETFTPARDYRYPYMQER